MKNRAVRFQKVPVAAEAVELPPRAATGMTIRPQIVEPQPAAIVTMEMGTKVPGGIDLTRSPVGWRYGSGPYWRRGSALHRLLLTKRTVGLVRQTCERFGLTGAVALGLDGISWPLADIPHRSPNLDAFLSVKPYIPFAQELQQVQVLVGQIAPEEPLPRDGEHMNPHKVVEDPPCGGGLCGFAFLVRKGGLMLLERVADALL